MKKIVIALLLLFSVSLVSCKKNELPSGSANTSFEKLTIGEIYTKELIENMDEKETITKEHVAVDADINFSDSYLIKFSNNRVYSISSKTFFPIDLTDSPTVSTNNQYVLVTFAEKYEVYHYIKAELLYRFNKADATYTFNYNNIYEEKDVDGETVTKTYKFSNYQPIDEPVVVDENPIADLGFFTIGKYAYRDDSVGVTIFKENKLYAHYFFEVGYENHFYLENGNILIQHVLRLPNDSDEYTYIDSNVKYKLTHYLYDVASKTAKVVNLNILIQFLQYKSEQFPIKVDNMIGFNTIDSAARLIVPIDRMGSLSNGLKLREVQLEFGQVNELMAFNEKSFAIGIDYGYYLINDKNELINSMTFNRGVYNSRLFKNETLLLRNIATDAIFIYNLRTGELLHKGYQHVHDNDSMVLLLKDDAYYSFNGELTKLDGEFGYTVHSSIYTVRDGTTYKHYYKDGTHLFNTDTNDMTAVSHYGQGEIIFILSYSNEGIKHHYVLRLKMD